MSRIGDVARRRDPWFETLRNLEMQLLDPEVRGDATRLGSLLGEDFIEFGSSGRVYERRTLIDMMVREHHAPVLIRDFAVRPLTDDAALVTYRSVGQGGQEARRSSVWVRIDRGWQIVFHQGTRIPDLLRPLH